ncbi:MAG: DNA-binding protein [Bacteroidales bacterium]|nr:DNA-binding protein [Bacteroidales bacterium]
MRHFPLILLLILILSSCSPSPSHTHSPSPSHTYTLSELFTRPPESAKPWVFWYWMKAAISKEGITADLEAMKENGIGGAYIFTIRGADDPPLIDPPVEQLSSEWWDMVEFAFREAKRLGLKLAMHACDGFTTAGGPWITPEMSMQKIVWSEVRVTGNRRFQDTLPQPETREGFYRDIRLFAYPTPSGAEFNTNNIIPKVSTGFNGVNPQYLCDPENKEVFRADESCWIQYAFEKPFTCKTIYIRTKGLNYQSHRLIIESSDDGIHFNKICRLEPPRHGWQDYEAGITHSIPSTTARYFRFVYDKEGAEPGSEDLDAARWNPALKIQGITLSGEAVIHQYEGKNGSIWRVSNKTTDQQVPDSLCVPMDRMINLSEYMDKSGMLTWDVPAGKWSILRIGHTSTGHTNYMGGKGKGLECDKFDPDVVRFQFNQWFGKAFEEIDPALAGDALKIFHIDSWECGSQNWSSVFHDEFERRRGYDLTKYLPVMTGIPLESTEVSERFLYDIRQTISELIADNFFGTMAELARKKGCLISAESVAPVMISDAMLHQCRVDIPMGEFWNNSPTHDKPTDILDAVSAAHVYGKPVVQAEAFTTLRMDWNESPVRLKTLGDRNFAAGINRFVFHVFVHNPWMDRKPGMTLNGVGLYFQRDQTWRKQGKAWMEYVTRCQALLQQGTPVVDIAVYTGEEIPRRALTPDRLIDILPGLFDPAKLEAEKIRLANSGVPMCEKPEGVSNSANSFDPATWSDPLNGYKYDAINKDALLRLAKIKNGKIVLPGGIKYSILVIPGKHKMNPDNPMSAAIAEKILHLINDGATVVFADRPETVPGLYQQRQNDKKLNAILDELLNGEFNKTGISDDTFLMKTIGKGRIIKAPFMAESFAGIGIERDFQAYGKNNSPVTDIAWCHRHSKNFDMYYISNQQEKTREVNVSVRTDGFIPEIFDPLDGAIYTAQNWSCRGGRNLLPLRLNPNASLFIVLRERTNLKESRKGENWLNFDTLMQLNDRWTVVFDPLSGGPVGTVQMTELTDWTGFSDDSIRYYSGTATYTRAFQMNFSADRSEQTFLDLGSVHDIAEVWVNGRHCGIAWTYPYRVDISGAVRKGMNDLEIKVTNTWRNRLIGDHSLPPEQQITWTTAPYRFEGKQLAKAGLLGPVSIMRCIEQKNLSNK